MGSGEPDPEFRIVRAVEEGIASLRPRIVLPADHSGGQHCSLCCAKPFQRFHETLDAALGNELPCVRAGRSPGKQRQDTGASTLLLVSIPDRADWQSRSVSTRVPASLPEPLIELQQCFRCPSIWQILDSLALQWRQRGPEGDAPQRGGGHGENKIVRGDLRVSSLRSANRNSHLVSTLCGR